jgi:hypothetical protein
MITSNSGVAGFNLKMSYDNSILEPVSVKQGSALDTGAIVSNLQQENESVDNVTIYWSNPSDLTNVGEAFTVRFKVSEKASGDYPITLSYEENDLPSSQNLSELETTITDGGLIVTDEMLCNINSLFTACTKDNFSAYVNYTNYSDKDAKLILAVYDDDGSMTDVIATPIQQTTALTTVISSDKIKNTSQVKAFIWNSEKDMVPLCKSLSYN